MKMLPAIGLLAFLMSCKPNHYTPEVTSISTVAGKVDARMKEASGLVASINNPGFLWSINDSGNPAEVFLINRQANIKMVCTLVNIKNRDWEDIAIDTAPNGKTYLYVADIGDNSCKFEYKIIYRFEEPILSIEKEINIVHFETFVLTMPDGKRDAETILIDPSTHDLFIISKREDSVGLYRAPRILTVDTMMFEKVLTLPFTQIVAGSITTNGQEILLKDYGKIYYWKRERNEPLTQVLATSPIELPYVREQQGEAIAWSRNDKEFFTLSESRWGKSTNLLVYVGPTNCGSKPPAN
jgi:hypothetical protein